MSSLMDFLRRRSHTVGLGGDGATIEDLQWVTQAAGQSQRSTYLTLTLMTALAYEQVLAIPQEVSQILHIESLYLSYSGHRVILYSIHLLVCWTGCSS